MITNRLCSFSMRDTRRTPNPDCSGFFAPLQPEPLPKQIPQHPLKKHQKQATRPASFYLHLRCLSRESNGILCAIIPPIESRPLPISFVNLSPLAEVEPPPVSTLGGTVKVGDRFVHLWGSDRTFLHHHKN